MVICRYFLQGICKFGDACRFEHTYSGNPGYGGRVGNQGYAGANYYTNQSRGGGIRTNDRDITEVLQMVVQEVNQWEKGNQWPLSCFAPLKEQDCFPGFEDHSPEELRWEAYQAQSQGTIMEYQKKVEELQAAAKAKRSFIKKPNAEVVTIIEKMNRGQKVNYIQPSSFSFTGQPTGFVSSQGTTSVFGGGGMPTGSSAFGGNSGFGSFGAPVQSQNAPSNFKFSLSHLEQNAPAQTSNVFGGGQVAPSTFGVAQPTSVFGGSGQSASLFGSSQTTGGSIFGGANTQQQSVFGGAGQMQNVFGGASGGPPVATSTTQVFGGQPAQATSAFGTSSFGSQPPQQGTFGVQNFGQAPAAFGSTPNVDPQYQQNVFGQLNVSNQYTSPMAVGRTDVTVGQFGTSGSVFSQQPAPAFSTSQNANPFGGSAPQIDDNTIYTPLSELTEEEKEQFLMQTFTLGKIPTRPPPKELCV